MLTLHRSLALFVCFAAHPWTTSAAASSRPKPVSNPSCPVYPPPSPGTCGPFTHNFCDSNTLGCAFQDTQCAAPPVVTTLLREPTVPKDVYISPEAYLYFKMLETEYMVEFAQNPMPGETPISLPFCGRPTVSKKRRDAEEPEAEVLEGRDEHLQKRNFLKKVFGGKPPGGFIGEVINKAAPIVTPLVDKFKQDLKTTGQILKEIEKGIAHIDIPWLDKAPKYHPRPVCVPRNITVPIHFTVFATNYTTSSQVTIDVIETQVNMMNAAYSDLGIKFFISTFSYHIGEEFRPFAHHDSIRLDDREKHKAYYSYIERMKQENRYGGFDEINVWIVESLTVPSCDKGIITDGYCTWARQLTYADRMVDGCVINMASLPNVTFSGLGDGKGTTLTHEIGHWFNLDHVFPEEDGVGCKGESDGIADTFQYPNDPAVMFDEYQLQCCHTGKGKSLQFFPCKDTNKTHVTNYMSYGRDKGVFDKNDPAGTRPWTMGQRAHMFASFFTIRRKAPLGGLDGDCLNYPVFSLTGSPASRRWNTGEFLYRREDLTKRGLLTGGNVLRQGFNILDTLKKVCAAAPTDPSSKAINVITGDEVQCDGTTCQAPPDGAICPDGSTPPCVLIQEPDPAQKQCPDGSPLPCGENVCPIGTSLFCRPDEGFLCPDGLKPPCNGTLPEPGEPEKPENNGCPKACNVHSNTCHASTAPNCIFPDPRVEKPRAACACRPGFKATGAADSDATKHWRLPIVGQEHRVWVAEGVPCDSLCQGTGFDACREVVVLDKSCI